MNRPDASPGSGEGASAATGAALPENMYPLQVWPDLRPRELYAQIEQIAVLWVSSSVEAERD